ncbi:hypothetical protein C7M84_008717 [Penaeus vannamei]|uniref:Craniofacial development protein 2-like n=1 Tax=Penaeus vannamei TaxID=6689 RepID=A0A3R7M5W9_PENVA|nr:hypothetical protein C7M84_008717 [Penaeus vannamei]
MPDEMLSVSKHSQPSCGFSPASAISQQSRSRNYGSVEQRRLQRHVQSQWEKTEGESVEVRLATLNIGTMTGKDIELTDMMERRRLDVLCLQGTKWEEEKDRNMGERFKLFHHVVDEKSGVGVMLKEEYSKCVMEVRKVSKALSVKLKIEGLVINIISACTPRVGCKIAEKKFWNSLGELLESIPKMERVVIGADFNGNVGEGNIGDEVVMGRYGVQERDTEGQMLVDFAKRLGMALVNTYFKKEEKHRVTYASEGKWAQVDYILCRRYDLKEMGDCKVILREDLARPHQLLVCRMRLLNERERAKPRKMVVARVVPGSKEKQDGTAAAIVRETAMKPCISPRWFEKMIGSLQTEVYRQGS